MFVYVGYAACYVCSLGHGLPCRMTQEFRTSSWALLRPTGQVSGCVWRSSFVHTYAVFLPVLAVCEAFRSPVEGGCLLENLILLFSTHSTERVSRFHWCTLRYYVPLHGKISVVVFKFPNMFAQCCRRSFVGQPKRGRVQVVPSFEFILRHSYIGFCRIVYIFDCCFVNYTFGKTFSFQWACLFFSTITRSLLAICFFLLKYFFVVSLDVTFYVRHAAVADLYGVFIKDFIQFTSLWKTLVD